MVPKDDTDGDRERIDVGVEGMLPEYAEDAIDKLYIDDAEDMATVAVVGACGIGNASLYLEPGEWAV